MGNENKGFTLLELLVVIGILSILATVIVLVINPVEQLKQARDARRIVDIQTLSLPVAAAQNTNMALGATNTIYVSIPDASPTCANSGLPTLPTGWTYACANSANYLKVDGTGWIPVNIAATGVSSMGTLPVDPINNGATGLYYIYVGGSGYALSASIESDKYLKQSALTDGGIDPTRIEMGSDLKLLAKAEGLVGYWPFDEGSGTVANDMSGNGNGGTWAGTGVHYSTGKINSAGTFNGTDDYVNLGNTASLQITGSQTIMMWIYPTDFSVRRNPYGKAYGGEGTITQETTGSLSYYYGTAGGNATPYQSAGSPPLQINKWNHVAIVRDLGTMRLKWYVNGVLTGDIAAAYPAATASPLSAFIGKAYTSNYAGRIDDFSMYSRALSATEVSAIYRATK